MVVFTRVMPSSDTHTPARAEEIDVHVMRGIIETFQTALAYGPCHVRVYGVAARTAACS